MNEKTAKLLRRYALSTGEDINDLKRQWYGMDQFERRDCRTHMRSVVYSIEKDVSMRVLDHSGLTWAVTATGNETRREAKEFEVDDTHNVRVAVGHQAEGTLLVVDSWRHPDEAWYLSATWPSKNDPRTIYGEARRLLVTMGVDEGAVEASAESEDGTSVRIRKAGDLPVRPRMLLLQALREHLEVVVDLNEEDADDNECTVAWPGVLERPWGGELARAIRNTAREPTLANMSGPAIWQIVEGVVARLRKGLAGFHPAESHPEMAHAGVGQFETALSGSGTQ